MAQLLRKSTHYTYKGIGYLTWAGIFCYALLSLAFILLEIIGTPNHARYEFAQTGHKLALLGAPLLMLGVIAFKRWRLALLLLPSLIVFLTYYPPYLLPKSSASVGDSPELTILTYNLLTPRREPEQIAQIILNAEADVVAVQELSGTIADYLDDALANAYPYQALHPQSGQDNHYRGQGIFSKYPILENEYWQYTDLPYVYTYLTSHGHQRVMLDFADTEIVIYNSHAWPAIEWYGGLHFVARDVEDEGHRVAIERVVARTLTETAPLLLVGDFNMTDQFYEYDLVTRYYHDTWMEVGNGLGFTYPSTFIIPIIRLDYVFHSDQWAGVRARVWDDSGPSDHYPVLVTLALRDNGAGE